MRKNCFVLACLLLLQLLIGCSNQKEEILQPVNFYYANSEISYNTANGVIGVEVREGSGFQNLEDLMHSYLRGPVSSELQNLIPSGVNLLSCTVADDTATVVLSSQFSQLSGVKLTTVCSAMLLTANDYSGVQTICVSADSMKLDDKDTFTLSLDDIVLEDAATIENTEG